MGQGLRTLVHHDRRDQEQLRTLKHRNKLPALTLYDTMKRATDAVNEASAARETFRTRLPTRSSSTERWCSPASSISPSISSQSSKSSSSSTSSAGPPQQIQNTAVRNARAAMKAAKDKIHSTAECFMEPGSWSSDIQSRTNVLHWTLTWSTAEENIGRVSELIFHYSEQLQIWKSFRQDLCHIRNQILGVCSADRRPLPGSFRDRRSFAVWPFEEADEKRAISIEQTILQNLRFLSEKKTGFVTLWEMRHEPDLFKCKLIELQRAAGVDVDEEGAEEMGADGLKMMEKGWSYGGF